MFHFNKYNKYFRLATKLGGSFIPDWVASALNWGSRVEYKNTIDLVESEDYSYARNDAVATRIDENGAIVTVPADVPRIDGARLVEVLFSTGSGDIPSAIAPVTVENLGAGVFRCTFPAGSTGPIRLGSTAGGDDAGGFSRIQLRHISGSGTINLQTRCGASSPVDTFNPSVLSEWTDFQSADLGGDGFDHRFSDIDGVNITEDLVFEVRNWQLTRTSKPAEYIGADTYRYFITDESGNPLPGPFWLKNEPAATNYITQSQDLTDYAGSGYNLPTLVAGGPTGTYSAVTHATPSTYAVSDRVYTLPGNPAGDVDTQLVAIVRFGSAEFIAVASSGSHRFRVKLNPDGTTVGGVGGVGILHDHGSVALGDGWFLMWAEGNNNGATVYAPYVSSVYGGSPAEAGSFDVAYFGLIEGRFGYPVSPIHTSGAPETRAADAHDHAVEWGQDGFGLELEYELLKPASECDNTELRFFGAEDSRGVNYQWRTYGSGTGWGLYQGDDGGGYFGVNRTELPQSGKIAFSVKQKLGPELFDLDWVTEIPGVWEKEDDYLRKLDDYNEVFELSNILPAGTYLIEIEIEGHVYNPVLRWDEGNIDVLDADYGPNWVFVKVISVGTPGQLRIAGQLARFTLFRPSIREVTLDATIHVNDQQVYEATDIPGHFNAPDAYTLQIGRWGATVTPARFKDTFRFVQYGQLPPGALLLESGDALLLESGDQLLIG